MPNVKNARILFKRSNIAGQTPTVPQTEDHRDGTWLETDIYEGEFFLNLADDRLFYRSPDGIKEVVTKSVQDSTLGDYNKSDEQQTWVPIVDAYGNLTWELQTLDPNAPPGAQNIMGPEGNQGINGTVMSFKGTFAAHPQDPEDGWVYKNSTDGNSYIYEGGQWNIMTQDGVDGLAGTTPNSFEYQGEFAEAPLNPEHNWVYKNTTDHKVYVYTNSGWELMTTDGSDGSDGAAGMDGLSVFITYYDGSPDETPPSPVGDGSSEGWHTDVTAAVGWMSQKIGPAADEGAWGVPIRIAGIDGLNGADGADGSDGSDAKAVKITATDQTIEYDSAGENPSTDQGGSTITLTAEAVNCSGVIFYEWFINDQSVQNDIVTDYEFLCPSTWAETPKKIEVQIREGSNDGTIVARDMFTILGLKPGQDGFTIALSNEAHTITELNTGEINLTDSGTNIQVYEGVTQLAFDDSADPVAGSFKVTATPTNVTPGAVSNDGFTATFADATAMSDVAGKIDFVLDIKNAAGVTTQITKTQTFAKSVQGADGVDGAAGSDGAAGESARGVSLAVDDQSIEYDVDGANPSPATVTVTATAVNTSDTVYYKFYINDVALTASVTDNVITYTPPADHADMPQKIEVEIREGAADGVVMARDMVTMIGLKPAADGESAVTILLTNESHTIPVPSSGIADFTGSGTEIQVFEGVTQAAYDPNLTTGPAFYVTAVGDEITPNANPTENANSISFGNASVMTSTTANIQFTINFKSSTGATQTFQKYQSFSRSVDGSDGADGPAGTPGAQGPGITMIGLFNDVLANTPTRQMNNGEIGRDVVEHDGSYWAYTGPDLAQISTVDTPATGSQMWTEFEFFSAVATGMLIAEESYVKNTINIGTNAAGDAANMTLTGADEYPYISIGQANGQQGFDNNGLFMGVHNNGGDKEYKMSIKGASAQLVVKDDSNNVMLDSNDLKMDAKNVGRQIAYSTEGYSAIGAVDDEDILEFPVYFLDGEYALNIMYRGFAGLAGNDVSARLKVYIQPIDGTKGYGIGKEFTFLPFGGQNYNFDSLANPGQISIPLEGTNTPAGLPAAAKSWDFRTKMCNVRITYNRDVAGSGENDAVFIRDIIVMTGGELLTDKTSKNRVESAINASTTVVDIDADQDMPIVELFEKDDTELEALGITGDKLTKYTGVDADGNPIKTKFSKFGNRRRARKGLSSRAQIKKEANLFTKGEDGTFSLKDDLKVGGVTLGGLKSDVETTKSDIDNAFDKDADGNITNIKEDKK